MENILSLRNITKVFPGVVALDNVDLDIRPGEVHALVGENGAGKSTLIKVITGEYAPERGSITVFGQTYDRMLPAQARSLGIEAIYQEYNLVNSLSAAENICLGKKYGRLVDFKKMNEIAAGIFDRFHVEIDPRTPVHDLTSAKMQIVEIAKAVSKDVKLLIMDEPTAPLSAAEVDILLDVVRTLRADGVTIIYISHRMEEIFDLCDRVSVFRDGKYIATRDVKDTTRGELIRLMVGREIKEVYPVRKTPPGEVLMELRHLSGNGVKNVSLYVRRGEVLGIGGLVGAGRSEIMRVVYGVEKVQGGEILIHGQPVQINRTQDAQSLGIGFLSEDRKREGVFLPFSIRWNTVISCLKRISSSFVVNRKKELEISERYFHRLRTKAPDDTSVVMNLSGGNQQKVVLSKVLAADAEIIIMDEPTRGIDVGAKQEIYELMNELCAEGKAIIMISSDMAELLGMSDRIAVLYEHTYMGEIEREDFSQELVLHMSSGYSADSFTPPLRT